MFVCLFSFLFPLFFLLKIVEQKISDKQNLSKTKSFASHTVHEFTCLNPQMSTLKQSSGPWYCLVIAGMAALDLVMPAGRELHSCPAASCRAMPQPETVMVSDCCNCSAPISCTLVRAPSSLTQHCPAWTGLAWTLTRSGCKIT